jgi:hypothetical protein
MKLARVLKSHVFSISWVFLIAVIALAGCTSIPQEEKAESWIGVKTIELSNGKTADCEKIDFDNSFRCDW